MSNETYVIRCVLCQPFNNVANEEALFLIFKSFLFSTDILEKVYEAIFWGNYININNFIHL